MLFKYIIALTLAAVAASQKYDNCTVALYFPTGETRGVTKAASCVFPELSHAQCSSRNRSLRVAFRASQDFGEEQTTCNYDVSSSAQISVTDFLNIPAVCSMLGGKMTQDYGKECISSE